MKILCTFPGRAGDILWSLPTMRAISEYFEAPVDLQIAGEFASLAALLQHQAYIGAVLADVAWGLTPPNEWQAPAITGYDHVFHLGYRGWPDKPLAQYIYDQVASGWLEPLNLETPWLTAPPLQHSHRTSMTIGFTEAHFELKYGLTKLLTDRWGTTEYWKRADRSEFLPVNLSFGSRWANESLHQGSYSWAESAAWIRNSHVFFGCCSALHVLAVGLGTPVVLMEPMEARWNDIFYPLGKVGPQVTLVMGLDGKPTFDARHCWETLQKFLTA